VAGCTSTTAPSIATSAGSPTSVVENTAPAKVVAAVTNARRDGTVSGPVQWVATTTRGFSSVSGSGPGAADVPIYVVEMQGHFVLNSAPRPPGAKSPQGSSMMLLVPMGDGAQGGAGVLLRPTATDLSAFGVVHWFRSDS
jgi:hypothetical protein